MTTGSGTTDAGENGDTTIREGDLVETTDFNFTANGDSKLIIVYEE